MCDRAGKLMAWFDGELPAVEVAKMERHLRSCAECRARLHSYKKVSRLVDAYCDAAVASQPDGSPAWPRPAVSAGVAATAMAVALFLFSWHAARVPFAEESGPRAAGAELSHAPLAAAFPQATLAPVSATPAKAKKTRSRRTPIREEVQEQAQEQIAAQEPRPPQLRPNEPPSAGPVIEVAIPADAMFAPGAVPEGALFVAQISLAADGSFDQIHLRP